MALETMTRQLAPHRLTKEQNQLRAQKDIEYRNAVVELSNAFYQKKRTVGATPEEETQYREVKATLWADFVQFELDNGMRVVVTPEQQLDDEEIQLQELLTEINLLRGALGKANLELRETRIRKL